MPSRSKFQITPPLLNSACPWSTTLVEIKALYESPYTGAVTTRTSLLEGFTHNPQTHQHVFFNSGQTLNATAMTAQSVTTPSDEASTINPPSPMSALTTPSLSSLNTYGYSPTTLSEYLGHINNLIGQRHLNTQSTTPGPKKPFILSVTGTPDEVAMAYALIANAAEMDEDLRLAMEINLSCPNIHGKPPPAYEREGLLEYLHAVGDSMGTYRGRMASEECVPRVGVKLPPYTYLGQFEMVVECLREVVGGEEGSVSVVDFVTCVNTLGSSLVLDHEMNPVLASESGTGVGGLAGAALHPLALGNVSTFSRLLNQFPETEDVMVIGVGGVEDKDGFDRMLKVGAGAVACASALGRYGIEIFEKITKGQ